MTDLTTLADRVEAGTVEMQRELLEAAYDAAFVNRVGAWKHPKGVMHRVWFFRKLDAGAYVDAAMMLIEGRGLWATGSMEDGPFARLCWAKPDVGFSYFESHAEMPALALAACALRAHASEATNV